VEDIIVLVNCIMVAAPSLYHTNWAPTMQRKQIRQKCG